MPRAVAVPAFRMVISKLANSPTPTRSGPVAAQFELELRSARPAARRRAAYTYWQGAYKDWAAAHTDCLSWECSADLAAVPQSGDVVNGGVDVTGAGMYTGQWYGGRGTGIVDGHAHRHRSRPSN